MTTRRTLCLSLSLALSAGALACGPAPTSTAEPLDAIEPLALELPGADLFPEGITADRQGTLYISSVVQGTIFRAPVGAAQAEPFIEDLGNGAVGVLADDERELLWVCRSNPTQSDNAPAALTYGLGDGQLKATHPFPGGAGFCNDFAIDDDGNVYVSDSWGHRIMRIAASEVLRDGEAETWLTDEALEVPQGAFGANGMAIDDTTLYVVIYETGELMRTAIGSDGQPGPLTTIPLSRPMGHPDGLRLEPSGNLLVVEGNRGALSRVVLDDTPAAVNEVITELDSPTTVAVHDGVAWLVVSQFDHLFGLDKAPATLPFTVVGADLER